MANTYLTRSQTGNTYTRTWTLSWWFKRSKLGTTQRMWSSDDDASGNNDDFFQWQSDDTIVFGFYASGYYAYMKPNRKFRDTNAWYHLVFTWDSTQTTASDRIKIYVNGVQETSFATATYPSQNSNSFIGGWSSNLYPIECGRRGLDNTQHFDGSMSHCHFTDGTAYDASAFGETDATTGEWKIKTSPSVTYGTNGFFILKDGNSVTDQSGEGNNFTVGGGTLTKTEDNPSNVFSTLDPLNVPTSNAPTFSNGNTKVVTSTGGQFGGSSNLGAKTGKYYFEIKFVSETGSNYGNISLSSSSNARESARANQHSNQVGAAYPNLCYEYDGNVYKDSGSSQGNFGTFGTGDIIMIAMDLDNQKAYFGKNGTWGNSGDPTSGSTGTGAATLSANNDFWHLALGDRNSSGTAVYQVNFGNGYFGTTQISSAGTNASGIGIFEYDVPTGYTALSTKGLNL